MQNKTKDLWNGIKETSFKIQLEDRRGSSHALPLVVNCKLQWETFPTVVLHRKKPALLLHQEEGRISPQPATQVSEKPSPPWIVTSFQWTWVQSSPSQFSPFLYKVTSLSFDLWTCLWLAIACVSWIAILLLPNKPISLLKSLAVLKVDGELPQTCRSNFKSQQIILFCSKIKYIMNESYFQNIYIF